MRIASDLAKKRHALMVTIFLIVVAVAVGIIACDGAGARTYQLTISGTTGGNVTAPGQGTFAYAAGTVVPLVATPDEGYEFRSWTGDIAYITNPDTTSTTITMNGNYAIVANFETEDGTGPGNGGSGGPAQP
jgi:hypothetical protein